VLSDRSPRRSLAVAPALAIALAIGLASAAIPARAAPKSPAKKEKKERKVTKARDYAKTLAVIKTTQGDITVRFFFEKAPGHVKNFIDLAAAGFYDGTLFHRVIPDFMVQGGDPFTKDPAKASLFGTGGNTDSKGRPLNVKAEFNDQTHRRGVLSMARASDPDSASSQFFIVVKDSPFLDRQYTAFGEVVKGLEVVDKLVTESNPDIADPRTGGKPRSYQKIVKIELVDDETPKP
jgi:cyclophilin family peptidyl-prolyl cis-trans isomerase